MMGISSNVAPPYIGHPDCVTMDEPLEDINAQRWELFLPSGQDAAEDLRDIPIDPSLLPRAQKNSALLEANSDNLDKNQSSFAKGIWPVNGDTTEDKDAD